MGADGVAAPPQAVKTMLATMISDTNKDIRFTVLLQEIDFKIETRKNYALLSVMGPPFESIKTCIMHLSHRQISPVLICCLKH